MQGTFNGLLLKRIIALKSCGTMPGVTLTRFRVLAKSNRDLEERLWLNAPARLILSSEEVEGTLIHYTADLRGGFYEITIESKG